MASVSSKRLFDLVVGIPVFIVLFVPMLLIGLLVKLTSSGPALHWSERIGVDNKIFLMPKFRTMRVDTPQLATHKLDNPQQYLTPIGGFLRKLSLDELPQFWSVIVGDMSLVGPRPALFNQDDLISLRTELGVHKVLPGITGWAQINGRDELSIPEKVRYDVEYAAKRSFAFDTKIILLTIMNAISSKGVTH